MSIKMSIKLLLEWLGQHDNDNYNPRSLKNPKLNHFTAFMCYVAVCWLSFFILPILGDIFLKISGLYLYLSAGIHIFLYIAVPCLVILFSSLVFQAACYDVETFLRTPRIIFVDQQYRPKTKKAIKYLAIYMGCSFVVLFCLYLLLIFANGLEQYLKIALQTIREDSSAFFQQDFTEIIRQDFYIYYSLVKTNFIMKMIISHVLLFLFYFFILMCAFGSDIFYSFTKVLQQDLWRL